jgi:hypothetical protein
MLENQISCQTGLPTSNAHKIEKILPMNLKVRRMVTKFYVISNEANEKLKQFHY